MTTTLYLQFHFPLPIFIFIYTSHSKPAKPARGFATGLHQITEQLCLIHAFLQHLLKAVLHRCNILMIGHSVPCIIGLQDLHGHLSLLQQFSDKNRDQVLRLQRITRHFLIEEFSETFFECRKKIRRQFPHIHGN